MSVIFFGISADDSFFWLQSYAENLKAPNIFYFICILVSDYLLNGVGKKEDWASLLECSVLILEIYIVASAASAAFAVSGVILSGVS